MRHPVYCIPTLQYSALHGMKSNIDSAYLGKRRAAWPGPPTAGTSCPKASARASKISSSSSTIADTTHITGGQSTVVALGEVEQPTKVAPTATSAESREATTARSSQREFRTLPPFQPDLK